MKRRWISLVCAAGLCGSVALGQHAPQPRGAADAVVTTAPAASQPGMPAGHPMIGGGAGLPGGGTMPPGHAGGGGMPGAGGLPAGHPPKNAQKAAIRVLVSQGTPGGKAITDDPVKITLLARGEALSTHHLKMDAKGVVEIKDLPLDVPFQPVITVTHGGVEEMLLGPSVTKMQPAIEMEMKVYETTAEKPEVTCGLRHVVMAPEGIGKVRSLKVTEMIGGYNPLNRAWVGSADEKGNRETFAITLPEGATNVLLGPGLLDAGAKVEGNRIVRRMAMMPGSTEYVFGYSLPVQDGKATLNFTAPLETSLMAVYVPEGVRIVKAEGLERGTAQGAQGAGGRQLLKAKIVKAGAVARVELSDISYKEPAASEPKAEAK